MTELISALVGALVGGAASWLQTKRVLQHEAALAREAAQDQRAATRDTMARTAALELLTILAQVEDALPRLRQLPGVHGEQVSVATGVLDAMRRVQISVLPVLPRDLQRRYEQLRVLIGQFVTARVTAADGQDPADWTNTKIARSQNDLESYLRYVLRSTVAVIDGDELPRAADAPYLRRQDMSVWQAPDESFYVDEE